VARRHARGRPATAKAAPGHDLPPATSGHHGRSPSPNKENSKLMDDDLRKRLLAIEVLLEIPEDINDALESELYALRDKFQARALT
jgi:hypothetical protein